MTREEMANKLDALVPQQDDIGAAVTLCAAAAELRKRCAWTEDADEGCWRTGCGHAWHFEYDGPTENQQQFCGYCGGALDVQEPKS